MKPRPESVQKYLYIMASSWKSSGRLLLSVHVHGSSLLRAEIRTLELWNIEVNNRQTSDNFQASLTQPLKSWLLHMMPL